MQQAVTDKAAEPGFFRALLEATVYAHVPRDDHRGRLRYPHEYAEHTTEVLQQFLSD